MSASALTDPIVKKLSLKAPVEKAFEHFTENIHVWWPLASHSLSLENAETIVFEAAPGGRIYEVEKSGAKREWGKVLLCEPPHRLVFSWVLEAPEKATEVEVQFADEGADKSSLILIHRGWDQRADGGEWRGKYNQGWEGVLSAFVDALAD